MQVVYDSEIPTVYDACNYAAYLNNGGPEDYSCLVEGEMDEKNLRQCPHGNTCDKEWIEIEEGTAHVVSVSPKDEVCTYHIKPSEAAGKSPDGNYYEVTVTYDQAEDFFIFA